MRNVDKDSLLRNRVIRFSSVGLLNTAVGYSIYAILVLWNVPYLGSLFMATIAGVIFNYFSIGRLVFKSKGGMFTFCKFIAAYGIGYLVNAVLLHIAIKNLLISPYVAQILCVPPTVMSSWILMNYWVYKND
jgi:putative flippase GtrA